MRRNSVLTALILLGGLAGCASTPTPRELTSARQSFAHARASGAAQLAPADLHDAREALDRAERSFAYDAESNETRHWAYIADRRAKFAEAQAGITAAQRQRTAAVQAYQAAQVELQRRTEQALSGKAAALSQTEQELARTREQYNAQLQATSQQLDAERRARAEAEQRAQAAMDSLRQVASVREEQRGLVITLSGSVVFVTGKSELLPVARDRLDQVAEALRSEPNQEIVIEGHTDSVGSEDMNQRLSQQRAESVRTYLISRGVPAESIKAVGMGESRPLATNDTPEGRANNRRVEIVVRRAQQFGSGQSGQGAQPQAPQQTTPQQTTPQQSPGTQQPGGQRPGQQQPATPQKPQDLRSNPYEE